MNALNAIAGALSPLKPNQQTVTAGDAQAILLAACRESEDAVGQLQVARECFTGEQIDQAISNALLRWQGRQDALGYLMPALARIPPGRRISIEAFFRRAAGPGLEALTTQLLDLVLADDLAGAQRVCSGLDLLQPLIQP